METWVWIRMVKKNMNRFIFGCITAWIVLVENKRLWTLIMLRRVQLSVARVQVTKAFWMRVCIASRQGSQPLRPASHWYWSRTSLSWFNILWIIPLRASPRFMHSTLSRRPSRSQMTQAGDEPGCRGCARPTLSSLRSNGAMPQCKNRNKRRRISMCIWATAFQCRGVHGRVKHISINLVFPMVITFSTIVADAAPDVIDLSPFQLIFDDLDVSSWTESKKICPKQSSIPSSARSLYKSNRSCAPSTIGDPSSSCNSNIFFIPTDIWSISCLCENTSHDAMPLHVASVLSSNTTKPKLIWISFPMPRQFWLQQGTKKLQKTHA